MSLQIPSYDDPYHSDPIQNAYAWISFLAMDFSSGKGRVVLNVNPDAASYAKPPLDQVGIDMGQVVAPGVHIPTLEELFSGDPTFAQAFGYIRQVIYNNVKLHPKFKDAIDVV